MPTNAHRIKTHTVIDSRVGDQRPVIESVATFRDTDIGRSQAELLFKGLVEATAVHIPDVGKMAEYIKVGEFQFGDRLISLVTTEV